MLDDSVVRVLTKRFTDAVMQGAQLPAARRADVEAAPAFAFGDGEIVCTCGITGSTYIDPWDGSTAAAEAFATEAGENTASLVRRAAPGRPKGNKYAWLYSGG